MTRTQSRYVCQACGDSFLRWEGQCRSCSAWNTLVETLVREASPAAHRRAAPAAGTSPVPLADLTQADVERIPVGIGELDRVLGGGLVPGSLVLVGGEPGIGKSTLLLQAAAGLSAAGPILYATGEESSAQVRLRAARLGLLGSAAAAAVTVFAESSVARILETARAARPVALVVDSIQTATVDELEGPAGSVGQVRESALRYMELAKGDGIAVLLVGHVTKEGSLAGPKTLEHLVDAVLSVEGDRSGGLRLVRAPVSTICVGMAASMAAVLLAAGHPGKRYALPHSRIMIHQGSGGFRGNTPDVFIQVREMETLVNANHELLARHTGQTVEKIVKDTERDYFMGPDQAQAYGIIDAVYAPVPKSVAPGLPSASSGPGKERSATTTDGTPDGPTPAGA